MPAVSREVQVRIYAILMLFRITFSKVIDSPPIKKFKMFLCPETTKPIETNDIKLEAGIAKFWPWGQNRR